MSADRDAIRRNLEEVRSRIAAAAARAGRRADDVTLVAVTKTVDEDRIRWAVEAGASTLGENYVQELDRKREAVVGATWHFVGTLRSGTAHRVADLADVVETVAGERAARRLAGRAARAGKTLDALIEVSLAAATRGVSPEDLSAFADLVADLEGLRLVGLMTIRRSTTIPRRRVRTSRSSERWARTSGRHHPKVLESSMGMSLDYEVAVEEGATMVRIGTALFGHRPTREEPG